MEPPFLSLESTERCAGMASTIHSSDTATKTSTGLPAPRFHWPARAELLASFARSNHRGGVMHDTQLTTRKNEHLDQVLATLRTQPAVSSGFEAVRFEHCALPELDLAQVDLSGSLFGKPLAAPLLISSMTGGAQRAEAINRHLAEAAEALGIALAV